MLRTKNHNTIENDNEEEKDSCEEWKSLLKSCQKLVQTLFQPQQQQQQQQCLVESEEEEFLSLLRQIQISCYDDIDWDANQMEWRNLWNLCYSNHPWMNVRKKTLLVQFIRVIVIPLTRYVWIPNLDLLSLTNFEIQSLYQQTLFQCSTWAKYIPEKEFTSELTWMIHTTYRISLPNLRRQIRTYIGLFLTTTLHHSSTTNSNTIASHSKMVQDTTMIMVDGILWLVHCILLGMKTTIQNEVDKSSWWDHCMNLLLSLHRPNSFILWRDQIPILQQYHEPLCCCLATVIQQDHSRLEVILSACIQEYQSCHNTPKQVLLLHEMDSFLNNTTAAIQLLSKSAIVNYMTVIAKACSSDHSRVAQRAMECIQHDYIQNEFLKQIPDLLYPILMKELTHNYTYELPWNPTVQKRTALILEILQKLHPQLFQNHCQPSNNNSNNAITSLPTPNISKESTKVSHVMAQWKQQQQQQLIGKNPPASVTGVAPWAISSSSQNKKSMQPPLTVTGAAPWAISSSASKSKIPKISSSRRQPMMKQQTPPSSSMLVKSNTQKNMNDGLKQMLDFIKKCKPKNDVRSKEKDRLLAESPVLLPELKFHDLVFGKVLGTGAFSTVYYTRRILPKCTQSDWPEYAVKIVSTTTLREHAYEYNAWREMTILSSMVHPNIARLISTFRFKKGAYFVLEYANYGDLYTVLNRSTPKHTLTESTTQILLGQVVAALHAIHESGFVFGDVKPENILVTTTGHVKLSDFGASRPITDKAHQSLQQLFTKKTSSFLYQLRNGDWKPDDDNTNNPMQDEDGMVVEKDDRVEGTKAYLPPEVLIYGQKQSIYADTYAFGCVLYQCLTGQLPEEQENDHDQQKQESKVVQFHSQKDTTILSPAAHSLIQTCRMTNPKDRPTMMAISTCDFFQSINVFSLYRQSNHNVNLPNSGESSNKANADDPNWAQRQLSTIWAPQPKAYDLSSTIATSANSSPNNNTSKPLTSFSKDPIIAGDEANGYFLTSSSSQCHKLLPKYHTKPNNKDLTRIQE